MTKGFLKKHKPVKTRRGKETVSMEVWKLQGKRTSGKGLGVSKKTDS